MRVQRQKVRLLQAGKADPDDIMLQKAKYQGQLNEYILFSRKMRLKQERERVYYDLKGIVATNTKEQNARYTPEMIRNAAADAKQYYHFKSVIGDDFGTLADFRQMKYNDGQRFRLLVAYERSAKIGMISPLSGFLNYEKLHKSIENSVVGIETAAGTKIVGISDHFMERVIGTGDDAKTRRPRDGVTVEVFGKHW